MNPPPPAPGIALLLGLVLAALAPRLSAEPQRYELDPVHTRVVFAVSHAGFSSAVGTVSGSTGILDFDPEDWTSASLDVSVPLQRLDLGDAQWNRATLARNLLDAERHPQARFVSTSVEPLAPARARITGLLTLRGQTREVVLEATLNALKRHPLPPFRRTAGFSATTTLSRSDFGITAWSSMIGEEVELRIEVEAVRARAGSDGPVDGPPAVDGRGHEDTDDDAPRGDAEVLDAPPAAAGEGEPGR